MVSEQAHVTEEVDALQMYLKTGFARHLSRDSDFSCACLSCGLDERDCPVTCTRRTTHKPICAACEKSLRCWASLRGLLAEAVGRRDDMALIQEDSLVECEQELDVCETDFRHL